MGRKVGYVYKTEKGIDDAKLATRITLGIDQTPNKTPFGESRTVFAIVGGLRPDTDDKQGTASTVEWNATTREWVADADPWIFNTDGIGDGDNNATDIFSTEPLIIGQVYKIIPYGDVSESEQWMAEQSGAGSTRVLVRLNADSDSGNAGEYAGDIVTQRTSTGNIVTANVTIWAPQVNEGDLPLTGTKSGRFYRADPVVNVTGIEDAIDTEDPAPATIYEIAPPVFLGV
jgi:hypothetical protein